MIGVVVPIHNEESLLPACLKSVRAAASHPDLKDEAVQIVAVLDTCHDRSLQIASLHADTVVEIEECNVGAARAFGAQLLLASGARWLAFTDADSQVPENWIVRQLDAKADAVCGTVSVDDWDNHQTEVRKRFFESYQTDDGHRHIHGANMGISADAYHRVGGFLPLRVHEDVALIHALEKSGSRIAWVADPCVATSGRSAGRIVGGFASFLQKLAEPLLAPGDMPGEAAA